MVVMLEVGMLGRMGSQGCSQVDSSLFWGVLVAPRC